MPQNPMIRALVIFLIGLLILLMGAAAYLYFTPSQQVNQASFDSSGSGAGSSVGTDYSLVNQAGERVSRGDFAGSYRLYYFGYTYCPDVCPTSLIVMGQAMSLLEKSDPAKAAKVQPLFITVDPERDTPQAMKASVESFGPNFVGLTGSPEAIAAAAKAYRVSYSKVENKASPGDYSVDHSALAYLMGRDGKYLTHFAYGMTPQEMAEKLERFL
jgi:cytochrome oxidase Cu insertion factor (SCO1/SenC/PrrC family)